jgi:hypothetical protein
MTTPEGLQIPYFSCEPDSGRGSITVTGTFIPDGVISITRKSPGTGYQAIRDTATQSNVIITGGFVREDPEAPIAVPVNYRVVLVLANTALNSADRFIQRNNIMTPDWTHGIGTWVAGQNRTLSIVTEDTQKHGRITKTTSTPGTLNSRTMVTVNASKVAAKRRYRITGEARVNFHDVNLWVDVRDNPRRTWQQVKSEFPTWNAIAQGKANQDQLGSLWIAVVNPTTGANIVAPVKVLSIAANTQSEWFGFSLDIGMPSGNVPNNVWVRLYHGTDLREYSADWDLGRFGMQDLAYVTSNTPYWFSGDTPTPVEPLPAEAKWPGTNFKAWKKDADIIWEGTTNGTTGGVAGNSTSLFYGASQLYADTVCEIEVPDADMGDSVYNCSPLLLNDPVMPGLGEWFGLIEVSDLSYAARQDVYSILMRSPQVVISDVRNWATGTLSLLTTTLEQRKMALALFQTGRTLLLRNPDLTMPEGGSDGPWYIAVGNLAESRPLRDHRKPHRFWQVPFVRVEKPVGLINVSTQQGQTWQQVKDRFDSWSLVERLNDTWMEVRIGETPLQPEPQIDGTPMLGTIELPTEPAWEAWSKITLPTT